MNAGFCLLAALLWVVGGAVGCASAGPGGDCCSGPARGVVRHVVLFKFKEGTPADQVRGIEEKFRDLKAKIPQIVDFEWGTNMSPENHAQGFTHCFLLTFRDVAARDAYLPHPAHKEFGAQLGPILDKVLVVDYLSKD